MSKPLPQSSLLTVERIDTNLYAQVRHWRILFGCTELELLAAVQEVGPLTDDVRRYLFGQPERGH